MRVCVAPANDVRAATKVDTAFLYELVSADVLPKLDLSISIKSRLFTPSQQPAVARFLRQGRAIFALFAVGSALGTTVLASDARIGRPLGLVSLVLQLPAPLAGLLVLRLYMLRELVKTFDFWFFFTTMTTALVLFGAQLADGRVCVVFVTWLCMVPNMLIDAHLRGGKRMVMSNAVAMVACAVLLGVMKFSRVDEANNFPLFRRGHRVLNSADFVFNGILTMIAVLARNLVRLRAALSSRRGHHEIYCVSLRSVLRIMPKMDAENRASRRPTSSLFTTKHPTSTAPSVDHVQRLMLKTWSEDIDGRRVLWPRVMLWIGEGPVLVRKCLRWFGCLSFSLSLTASLLVSVPTISHATFVATSYATIVCTLVFVVICAASCQRLLLWRLVSSFDFLYISLQLTIIHLTACDYSEWHVARSLTSAASWLWIHWALCVDAVSPLVKNTVRVGVRFPAVVLTLNLLKCLVLLYAIVFLDTSEDAYDRTILLFNARMTVAVIPIFINSLASLVMIATRMVYRAWTFSCDQLLVLEGQVVYQNYLANSKLLGIGSLAQSSPLARRNPE